MEKYRNKVVILRGIYPFCGIYMRKSTILLFCLACFVISMTLGCKDKKPEVEPPVVVVDTMEIVDTVPQVVIDTVPETARDSLISATPVPKAADELFDDFLFLFTANKKLQYERVDFPLPVFEGDSQSKIEKKDWKMERFFSEQEFFVFGIFYYIMEYFLKFYIFI